MPLDAAPFDVAALLRAKNPGLAARLPAWAVRAAKRVVHQDEVNEIISSLVEFRGAEFAGRALDRLGIRVEVQGVERLPPTGRITLCANHPTGGADGLALIKTVGGVRGEALLPANDLLFSIPQLADLFVPVDKYGSNLAAVKAIDSMYASERPVVVFPAGRTSRPHRGRLREYPWVKSFIKKSRQHRRLLVPVHLSGRNSTLFYALWRLRTLLGIRAIIEVFLLVDELFKKRGSTVVVSIGYPIPVARLDAGRSDAEWAELLRMHTQSLGDDPDARFMRRCRWFP